MSYDNAKKVVNELFDSLPFRCQAGLETSMRGSDFIFDSVQLLYYKCQKINLKCGGLYIDSEDWIKRETATINPRNTDDNFFQYAGTVALNYEEVESHLEIISNIKPFTNKYNWTGVNYSFKIYDWKTSDKNNPIIALNTLYIKEKEIYPAYISKHNSTGEKQIIISMISK